MVANMDWVPNLFNIPQDASGFMQLLFIIRRLVAFVGVLVILWGAITAIVHFIQGRAKQSRDENSIDRIRLQFGRTIILGLEFIVAADVIETTTAPDYYTVGILAALVGIRTLLTFFMNREMIALGKKK